MATSISRLATASPLGSAPMPPAWTDQHADGQSANGPLAAEISTQLVSLLRRHAGRGPTMAKTTMSADLVVVTLENCLTPAERRVAACGHTELINRSRHVVHQAMRAEATAIVEDLTHRPVAAYLTDQEHDPDVTIIIFYLTPPAAM